MKTRLLKITLSFAMLFIAAGVFAQTHEPYTEMTNDYATTGDNDTVTVSNSETKWVPYYVEPDATLNNLTSNYDPNNDDEESQGVYTDFTWTYDNTNGSVASLRGQPNAGNDSVPYIELQFTTANGNGDADTLVVTETSQGSCAGSPVKLPIVVVDEPSFDVTTDGDNDTLEICDRSGEPINVASIASSNVQGGDLKFQVDSTIETINTDGSQISLLNSNTVYPTIPEDGNLGQSNVTVFSHDLETRNSEITRYSFTFNGISDHISRKTDYLSLATSDGSNDSEYNYYGPSTGGDALVYIVYPTPSTGDMYYVPNNFDQ